MLTLGLHTSFHPAFPVANCRTLKPPWSRENVPDTRNVQACGRKREVAAGTPARLYVNDEEVVAPVSAKLFANNVPSNSVCRDLASLSWLNQANLLLPPI